MKSRPSSTPCSKPRGSLPWPPIARERWTGRLNGLALGVLIWSNLVLLGINPAAARNWNPACEVLVFATVGAAASRSRARAVLTACGCGTAGLVVLVGLTPLTSSLVRPMVAQDPLQPADAVYVLGSGVPLNGVLPTVDLERVLHGLELVRQGYAPRLLVARLPDGSPSYSPAVQAHARTLGIALVMEEVGPSRTTHDEAVNVGRLAAARGWRRVIVVTTPAHSRRTRAAFRKQGIEVISSPCPEARYTLPRVAGPEGRFVAFRDWARETLGWALYRSRGWL